MAVTYVGSQGAAGTGAVTPGFPAGVTTGDFLLLRIEGEGEDGNADGPPAGGEWTAVGVGSVASATDGASDRTRLSVYWAPYDPDINRTVPDAGNHCLATIDAFRGVDLGNPFDDTPVSGSSATNATSHSANTSGLNSTVDDAMAVLVASHGDDALNPTNAANASLSDVTLREPWATSQGSDATTLLITGEKASPGAIGTFTWSTAATEERAWIAFVLRPAGGVEEFEAAATVTGGGSVVVSAETEAEASVAGAGAGAAVVAAETEASAAAGVTGAGAAVVAGETESEMASASSGAGAVTVAAETEGNAAVGWAGSGQASAAAETESEAAAALDGGGEVSVEAEALEPAFEVAVAVVGSGTVTVAAESESDVGVTVVGVGSVLSGGVGVSGKIITNQEGVLVVAVQLGVLEVSQ